MIQNIFNTIVKTIDELINIVSKLTFIDRFAERPTSCPYLDQMNTVHDCRNFENGVCCQKVETELFFILLAFPLKYY